MQAFNNMFFNSERDLVDNDSEKNCLKNVKYKIKNGYDLSNKNLSRISAPSIMAAKIENLDFMQWAILKKNECNVRMLSRYFDVRDYAPYLKTLSIDVQTGMTPLLGKIITEQHPQASGYKPPTC